MRQKLHRLALAAAAVISLLAPATAAAKATPTEISAAKTKGVEYLKGLQKTNGEIAGFERLLAGIGRVLRPSQS